MKYRIHMAVVLVASLLAVQVAFANDAPGRLDAIDVTAEHKAIGKRVAQVALGLETSLKKDDVKVAKKLYELEVRTNKLLRAATGAKFKSSHAKRDAVSDLRGTMRQVLRLQERVLDHTLAELDRALPGEPHRQLWAREGVDLYRPLFRSGTPKPGQPKKEGKDVLRDMQQDFKDKGGKRSQIHYLGPKTIQKFQDGSLVEWVQIGNRIRVTDAGAKHPVIALDRKKGVENGKSVRGAGSMQIIRGAKGEVVMVVVSNSSGNYKPGIGSTIGLVNKLEKIGVPTRRIAVTSVLPGEPVLVKLLLKSKKKYSKEQIKEQVGKLRKSALAKADKRATPKRALVRAKAKAPKTARRKAARVRSQRASTNRRHRERTARNTSRKRTTRNRARAR